MEEWRARAFESLPLRRISRPEDIANLALFLAADDSRSITKQCFMINGGSR